MITVTPAAARQIRLSAEQSHSSGMPLRIAATRNADKSIHYGMGFDDAKEDDISVKSDDVEIVVAPSSADLLKNAVLDFVEIEPGRSEFIFMNPNDPSYVAPKDA